MRGSCNDSHPACGWHMLVIWRFLCLIAPKLETVWAERVNDWYWFLTYYLSEMVTLYMSEIFSKVIGNQSINQSIIKARLSVLQYFDCSLSVCQCTDAITHGSWWNFRRVIYCIIFRSFGIFRSPESLFTHS